jgi:hypothetical protein
MPSGEPLEGGAVRVHELAVVRLADTLAAVQTGASLPGRSALT